MSGLDAAVRLEPENLPLVRLHERPAAKPPREAMRSAV